MSELDLTLGFQEDLSGIDIDAIFNGSGDIAPPPPECEPQKYPEAQVASADDVLKEESTSEEASQIEHPLKEEPSAGPSDAAVGSEEYTGGDLFHALSTQSEKMPAPDKAEKETASKQTSLFDKAPVFSYGGAKESITDTSMTFEELRIAKSDDFPELAEGKNVSWSVEYGRLSKTVSDPKGTTIARIKEEIEQSKTFLDALKKGTVKNPDCLVKPRVTAQNKGIARYKGVFTSLEEAEASDKAICLIPAQDGHVYELRKTEMGTFVAPKYKVLDFPAVRAGFTPALPPIPWSIMGQIIAFFRCFMNKSEEFEALAHIYWDKELEEYTVFIPRQRVSKVSINAELGEDLPTEDRYIRYADVHSHNSMAAKFSSTDDEDERATRLYFVIGQLDHFFPAISARFSCGGTYQPIDPHLVLESISEEFPSEWLDRVSKISDPMEPHPRFGGFGLIPKGISEVFAP